MTNYTKGEWKILEASNKTFFIRNDQGLQVCEYIKTREDANLLSAAPDMYKALKLLIERFNEMDKKYSYPMSLDLPRVWAEKALAKAEGK